MHILGSMKCGLFQFDNKKYTLLIMARLKQAYYGSCFVASCMHLQLKKVDPFITKRAHQISVTCMGPYLIIPRKYPELSGLDIRLVDAVARGASRFENLLAPQKTYWPPIKLTGPFPKTKLVRSKKYLLKKTYNLNNV